MHERWGILSVCLGLMIFGVWNVKVAGAEPAAAGRTVWAGEFSTGTRIYRYGHRIETNPPDHDGVLVIADVGDESSSKEMIFDRGGRESILFVGTFDDGTLFLILRQSTIDPITREDSVRQSLIRINQDGIVLREEDLDPSFCHFHNLGWRLVVRPDSVSAQPMAIDAAFGLEPLTFPDTAEGQFSFQHVGEASVDGVPVDRIFITRPGNHDVRIVHDGQTFLFTVCVVPEVEGIESEGEYSGSVRIVSAGELALDGHPMETGDWVSEPGNHRLTIRGSGDYLLEIPFVLHPTVEGIEADGQYPGPVRIVSVGELALDGSPFSSGETVSEPGNHRLTIRGSGDYVLEIPFILHPTVQNLDPDHPVSGPIRLFSDATAMELDGTPVTQGTFVVHSGFHRLKLFAANGYQREITFGILPSVRGLTDGTDYSTQAVFTVNGVATLDGEVLDGDEQIVTAPGTHVLMLWLGTERTATYTFTVTASDPVTEESLWPLSWLETGLGVLVLLGLFLSLKKK